MLCEIIPNIKNLKFFNSLPIAVSALMQGENNSENVQKASAEAFEKAEAIIISSLYNIFNEDTILSLAINPENKETVCFQSSNPIGSNIGKIALPIK